MSLALDVDRVSEVLIGGTWYGVKKQSFSLDSYEYIWFAEGQIRGQDDPTILHGGGNSDVCASGFMFTTTRNGMTVLMSGPLTAIQAVSLLPLKKGRA